jgi:hypothetical protein
MILNEVTAKRLQRETFGDIVVMKEIDKDHYYLYVMKKGEIGRKEGIL